MIASDFIITNCQVVAFTPGGSFRLWPLVKDMRDTFGEYFPMDPISQPLPDNAPPELPRLILRNKNETCKMQIAPARVDMFFSSGNPSKALDVSSKIDLSLKILDQYEETARVIFGRLSLVIIRLHAFNNPALHLAKHFCKPEWITSKALNRPQTLEMHAFKRYRVNEDFPEVNSWIRHKAGEYNLHDSAKFTGILVEQDLNTPLENLSTAKFEKEDRRKFFKTIYPTETDKIISDYYPET